MQKKKTFFFSFPSAKYLRRSQSYEKTSEIPNDAHGNDNALDGGLRQ